MKNKISGRLMIAPVLACATLVALLFGQVQPADAKCRAKNIRKIKKLTKQALEDYQMLEIKSALKRIVRAIDHGIDNDCDEKVAHARALMVRGIIHLAGQQDKTRGELYLEKAIKANACVKLSSGQPPSVSKTWRKIRRRFKHLKCGGVAVRIVEPPPTDRPTGGPCSHNTVEDAKAGKPVAIIVNVQSDVGAQKVVLLYRPHGAGSFTKLRLTKPSSGTSWTGTIPGKDVHGTRLAYYIEVLGSGSTVLCKPTEATAGAPEIIMVKGDPCLNLPPDFCESNKDHACCTRPSTGSGRPKKPGAKSAYPRFYLNAGFATGFGYLSTSAQSWLEASPYTAGFAAGPLGGQIEFGYFLGQSHLISLAAKFGVALTETSDTPVIAWQALARYRFFVLGGGKKDLFSMYIGAELGGAMIYHSLEVQIPPPADNIVEKDTFEHGFVLVGALAGFQIGTQMIAWYVEVDPAVIFPKQTTFHIGLSTGVVLRF
jgi:hypothetical protein